MNWNKTASNILKAELKRRDITYNKLSDLLKTLDIEESPGAISRKINYGAFSFLFFLQCMKAIGNTSARFDID